MVWFPRLVAAETVGQISVSIYDLNIFHLYIQSLSTFFGHSLACEKSSTSGKASNADLYHSEIVQSSP